MSLQKARLELTTPWYTVCLDEAAVDLQARAAMFSYSGPVLLPLNRATLDGPLVNFSPHNLREGFHALYALVRYRHDPRAREIAERSIAAIGDLWEPAGGWNLERIRQMGLNFQPCQGFVPGEARMLGPHRSSSPFLPQLSTLV